MTMFGGHSNLGKMSMWPTVYNFRFYEDRYPCRGGGRRGGRPIANGKSPKKGRRRSTLSFLIPLIFICLPAQRGT